MKIFIGIGHGGQDSGGCSKGFREKDLNLEMGLMLRDLLLGCGFEVVVSRDRDVNSSLKNKLKLAKACKGAIAVDLHVNAGKGTGFEVFRQTGKFAKESLELSKSIDKEVRKFYKSRGIKIKLDSLGTDYFGFLRENTMPAVILEAGFIDSSDMEFLATREGKRAFVFAYASGISNYIKERSF